MAQERTKVQGISYGGTSLTGNLSEGSGEKSPPDDGRVSVSFGTPSAPPELQAEQPAARATSAPSAGAGNSEAKAVLAILRALEGLDRAAVEHVLNAVVEEYAARVLGDGGGASPAAPEKSPDTQDAQSSQHGKDARLGQPDLPTFIATSGVKSDSWRSLMVAYWMTLVEGAESFTPTDLERELAHMQQPVDDIDEAFAALLGRGYAAELPGKGSIKRYMVTPEGINAVWQKFG